MTRVWDTPCWTHTEKLILLALADNANDQGTCYPSLAHIALKCDLSERAVRVQLRKLEEGGFILTHVGGGRRASVYTVFPNAANHPGTACPSGGNELPGTPAPASGHPGTACPSGGNRMPPNRHGTVIEPSCKQRSAPADAGDATSGQRDCAGKPVEASGTKSTMETLLEPEKPGTGPKRAKPSRPEMTPEAREQSRRRQEFIDGWWQAYRQRTGMPYHPANRDADIASANRITSNGRSVSELLDLARFAWEEGNVDQWTWNQAQTVAGFAARIAAIQAAYVQKRGRKLSPEEKAANIAAGDEYKNNLDW